MRLTGKMICYFLVVVLVSSIGFGLILYDSIDTKNDIRSVHEDEFPRLAMINEVIANSLTEAANIRGYVLTRDEKMFETYKKASDENAKIEADLLKGARTEERRKAMQFIIETDNKYSEAVEKKVIPLVKEGKIAEATEAINETAQHAATLLKAANEYKKMLNDVSTKALVGAIDSAGNTIKISIMAAIISAILGIIIAFFSARNIAGKVGQLAELAKKVADGDLTHSYRGSVSKDEIGDLAVSLNSMVAGLKQLVTMINGQAQNIAASSEELTASADQSAQASAQVADSITEVANGTGKQLDSVKMANSVVENMVAELEEVSANVGMVADKAVKTADMATTGGKSATRAITQMNEVEKTVSESAKVVARLGERSQEIGQIVDTISSIAGQTNLLALNAAIEAARAGEQGRGFAVVAEEVRKLAEQSQEAAKRIAGLIGEIQVETSRAVTAMDNGTREVKTGAEVVNETGVSFQEIIELVNQVSEQVNGIAKVVQSVAEGSEQIVSSVQDISDLSNAAAGEIETVSAATEEQSASMQQIAAASQNLSKLAQDMQGTVERFRI